MRIFPIIPIWVMAIICILLLTYIILKNNKRITQILIIILLFLINLRIMIPSNNSLILSNNLDVLFVIDNTISMNAEDYDGNKTRLSGVKKDCKYIIEKLNGARFSVLSFDNKTKILIPYTKDANLTNEAIEILKPIEELYAKGSSLNTPIDTIISSLESAKKNNDRIRIIFFISDGEITDESKLESYKEIGNYIKNGAVLGYGTEKGGYMQSYSSFYEKYEYIEDYNINTGYGKAISKIDEKNLKTIANDMNIDYIHMEKTSNIDSKLNEIIKQTSSDYESSDKSTYDDLYFIFVIPLFVLIMIEFNHTRRKTV